MQVFENHYFAFQHFSSGKTVKTVKPFVVSFAGLQVGRDVSGDITTFSYLRSLWVSKPTLMPGIVLSQKQSSLGTKGQSQFGYVLNHILLFFPFRKLCAATKQRKPQSPKPPRSHCGTPSGPSLSKSSVTFVFLSAEKPLVLTFFLFGTTI